MARNALGRGLSALIPTAEAHVPATGRESVQQIDIDLLEPNEEQPRTKFSEVGLMELAESIQTNGVIQPLLVRKKGQKYQIVAGERRWRAAQQAGLLKVPALVREFSKQETLQIGLIENLQREDLNPIDAAMALARLMEEFELTQEQVSERTGLDRAVIANTVRLLNLDAPIREMILEGRLSAGHGRALLGVEHGSRYTVAVEAANKGKSVRWIESWRKKRVIINDGRPEPGDPNIDAALRDMMFVFQRRITLRPHRGRLMGGELIFHFSDGTDLMKLHAQLIDERLRILKEESEKR